jgi:outer membrane protein assembly factor BamA
LKIKILFITLLIIANHLSGQNFNDKQISSILVVGNEDTKEDIIKRELLLQVGDTFSDSLMTLSGKRVSSLLLFNRVEIVPVPDNDKVSLLVIVTEKFFLFPFPEFRIEDRDWDKLSYGFGLAHINFRGRNEKLIGVVVFGYRPGFQLDYFNPWIGEENRYTQGISVRKYSSEHKIQNFDEEHFYINWYGSRYWDRYFSTQIGIHYDYISVPEADSIKTQMLTGKAKENLFGINLSFSYDNRDFIAYPSSGWFANLSFFKEGLFEPKIDYFQILTDIRHYKTFGPLTLAGRAYMLHSFGDLPLYKQVYFGFKERIRGHFSEIYSGKHAFVTNIEMRLSILGVRHYNMPSVFLPESSTQNLKFGLNAALFFDTGMVWGPNENGKNVKFKFDNFLKGFGLGLHFILPYVEVARLEIGFDENQNSEIIFEIGTAL